MVPDPSAHNWRLDMPAAEAFFATAQQNQVQLVTLSRSLSQACAMPRVVYEHLGASCGGIGTKILDAQRSDVARLWRLVCEGKELPERCDREWFCRTFCGGGEAPTDTSEEAVWAAVASLSCHAPMALLAALPAVAEECFEATEYTTRGVDHKLLTAVRSAPTPRPMRASQTAASLLRPRRRAYRRRVRRHRQRADHEDARGAARVLLQRRSRKPLGVRLSARPAHRAHRRRQGGGLGVRAERGGARGPRLRPASPGWANGCLLYF